MSPNKRNRYAVSQFGAGDEARTRYLDLGKVALYQMSYARRTVLIISYLPPLSKLFASSYVVMLGRREKVGVLTYSRALAFNEGAYKLVAVASVPQGCLACSTEDGGITASLQVEQAVTRAVMRLCRHAGVVEDVRHHVCEFLGCLLRTLYVLACAQASVLTRLACQMLLYDRVLAFAIVSYMCSDEFSVHIDLHE